METRRLPGWPFAFQGGPVVLAHRGWGGRFPENTMLAFQEAATLPIDGLELDIHSTADGTLVVIHDETVDRTTNGTGRVQSLTLAELQQLDAGYRWTPDGGRTFPFRGQGITVPALEELFAAFSHLWINVDIKQRTPAIVRPFAEVIEQFGLADNLCVGSFDTPTVEAFRQRCPQVVTVATLRETRRLYGLNKLRLSRLYWGKAQALQIPEYYGRLRVVDRRFVQAAHQNNMAVHVWTVNDVADMERLLEIGVDGLITDHPDRLLKLLGRM